MKFLVDAQLPPALCGWLKARSHSAVHVFEIGMTGATDKEIVKYSISEEAILLSKDDDFLVLRLSDKFIFIWVRCGNTTTKALFEWLEPRWDRTEEALAKGERLIELI